jgi:hypothetical protein
VSQTISITALNRKRVVEFANVNRLPTIFEVGSVVRVIHHENGIGPSRRQPTPQTFLDLRHSSSRFGAPFPLSSVFCSEMIFVTAQPFGQAPADVAWLSVRLYVSPQVISQ